MKICERPEFKSKKPPLTFSANDKVLSALKAMSKDNFGSVIIVDKQKSFRYCNRKRSYEKTFKQFNES